MSTKADLNHLPVPKVLLFDWDGTLVDTHPVLAVAMNEALKAFGKDSWTFEQWSNWLGQSARDVFPDLFGEDWEEARRIYLDAYSMYHLERLELKPGAADLMQFLASTTVYLGVVSNKTGDILRCEVTHLNWGRHFGHVIGAGDSDRDKPAPDPVHAALTRSDHVAGPDVWFVGDNAVDVDCGKAANCTTILIGDGYPDAQPDHRLTDLKALQTLISGTFQRS